MSPSSRGVITPFAILVLALPSVWGCSDSSLQDATEVVEVVPDEVDFGTAAIGLEVEASFLLRNRGRAPVGAELTSSPPSVEVSPDVVHLPAGAQLPISLRFQGRATGNLDDTIQWSTSEGERLSVKIVGQVTSAPISILEDLVNFGNVRLGETVRGYVEISSEVDHELSFDLPAPQSEALRWDEASVSLAPRGRALVTLTFTPVARGGVEEELLLLGFEACQPVPVLVIGRAVDRDLRLVPSGIDFGVVPVGTEVSRQMTLQNIGEMPLDLSVELAVARGPFAISTAGAVLEPGEELAFEVRFEPTEGGLRGAPLRVRDRSSDLVRDAVLQGTGGSKLVAIPAELDFGQVPAGFTLRRSIRLQNVGLGRTIEIRSVGFGLYSPAFRVVDQKVGDWIGVEPLELEVELRSWLPGVHEAVLRVETSDTSQVVTVPLRGEVGDFPDVDECGLTFHPANLAAGLVPLWRVLEYEVFVVNEGPLPCFIREAGWHPGHEYVDPVLHDFEPEVLAPGAARRLRISALSLVGGGEKVYTAEVLLNTEDFATRSFDFSYLPNEIAPFTTPTQLIFEPTSVGAQRALRFVVSDPSGVNLLRSVSLEGPVEAFRLVGAEDFVAESPVDDLEIEVIFAPEEPGYQHAQVEILLRDFLEPVRVHVVGLGSDPKP